MRMRTHLLVLPLEAPRDDVHVGDASLLRPQPVGEHRLKFPWQPALLQHLVLKKSTHSSFSVDAKKVKASVGSELHTNFATCHNFA